jgi:hypothetical protein
MKRVIRENLNRYDILTDPSEECIIKPLVDLFLISENELFISDYNPQNHTFSYQDKPVILEESANLTYIPHTAFCVLKAVVGDKYKNQRTYY